MVLRRWSRRARPTGTLVLLDVMMPGLDGYEICRPLRAIRATARIPVMFIPAVGPSQRGAGPSAGSHGLHHQTVCFRLWSCLAYAHRVVLYRQNLGLEALVKQRNVELVGTRLEIIHRLGTSGRVSRQRDWNARVRMSQVAQDPGAGQAAWRSRKPELMPARRPMHESARLGSRPILLKSGPARSDRWG